MKHDELNVVDFHAHILPGADHGSASLETSLAQLALAAEGGVTHIVATPHFYPDRHSVDEFLSRRERSYTELLAAMGSHHPRVALSAEVLICDGIERLEGLEQLCVRGTNTLLLELPFSVFKNEYCESVFRLIKRGFNVVLAHVDRYSPEDIDKLADVGAAMQLNAHAFDGIFVPSSVKRWLKSGQVIALGSDIHGADKNAYVRFSKAKKRILKLGACDPIIDFSRFLEKIF